MHLSGFKQLNCLDLGCRFSFPLMAAYHIFNCNKLVGVDKDNEEKCVAEYIEHYKNFEPKPDRKEKLLKCKSFFDLYSLVIYPTECEKPKIASKSEFDKVFLTHFKKISVQAYLEKEIEKFHLIIISNLLHLFMDQSIMVDVLTRSIGLLAKNGILLIRVQNRGKFNYPLFKNTMFKLCPNTEIHEYYNDNEWHNSIIITEQDLLKND